MQLITKTANWLEEEEANSMTLQVALVGTDAVVLASDRCMTRFTIARDTSQTLKIVDDPVISMVYSFSGDNCAYLAGEDLRLKLRTGFNMDDPRLVLAEQANARYAQESQRPKWIAQVDRRLLVILYNRPEIPALWEVEVSESSVARPITNKVVAGDGANTARFFTEQYYSSGKRAADLKLLAAHTILMGHERNQPLVEGLEMVVVRPGKCERVPQHELDTLSAHSNALDQTIRSALFVDAGGT